MSAQPTYEELARRVQELESAERERAKAGMPKQPVEGISRSIYEQAPLGYQSLDEQGRIIDVNQAWLDTLGYAREEVIGQSFGDFLHPDWQDHFKENFPRFKAVGEILGVEFEMLKKDGSLIMVSFNGKIGTDDQGHFQQTHCILHNITERKQAEKALKKSELQFKLVTETIKDVFWMSTCGVGRLIYVSPSYALLWQRSAESLYQSPRSFVDAIHPDDRKDYMATIDRYHRHGKLYECEYRILRKDGDVKWIQERGFPVPQLFEGDRVMTGICTDITARKQAEAALRKSEERYRGIFENAVEGFYQSLPEGRFISVNPAFAKMLGYASPDDLVNTITDIATQYYVDPEDRVRFLQQLKTSGSVENFEFQARRKDGSAIWVSNSTRAFFDARGKVVRYEGIVLDITRRKEAEKEKEVLASKLRQAQKLESIGNLAGGIAHDFNNILSSIIGFTELALEDAPVGTLLEDNLQEVFAASKRAKELVQQILAFARQSEEEHKPIQLSKIIAEGLKFIRSTIPSTVNIRSDIESHSLIMGNATQIHQILINLCTNAAQAMETQGGVLAVSLKDVNFDNQSAAPPFEIKQGDYIELKVSDTGIGIPPDIVGLIFEPYFTTKDPSVGTGMGLSVVHGIVESHGGKITVDSVAAKGAVFNVYLPITRRRKLNDYVDLDPLPTGTEHILFVDDEAPITEMAGQALERLGYRVTVKTSSVEARDLFLRHPEDFDLVITDMTMPDLTGDQLAAALMAARPDIPVILCTGYSKHISEEQAVGMGIKTLAYKPIVKAGLAKIVREVLDGA